MLALAKAVANATAAMVLKAKTVASKTEDQELQNRVIGSATQCALNTSQLVACTKVITTFLICLYLCIPKRVGMIKYRPKNKVQVQILKFVSF